MFLFVFIKKNSFRIIMVLISCYDLELYQINVKIAFLNRNVVEEVYMDRPLGFLVEWNIVCKLKKLIYKFKQVFKKWYIEFTNNFKVKYMRDTTYITRIEKFQDSSKKLLGCWRRNIW